jgi:hypothetical protein
MCLIIACEPTRKLPAPTFHAALLSAASRNPDGIGLSWAQDGEARIFKSLNNYNAVIDKALHLYSDTCQPFAVHLRYNTVGKNSKENTHPFAISNRIAMMHNKTLWIEPPNRSWSDSRTVAELLSRLCKADPNFFDSQLFYSFIEHQAEADNRFVFVDGEFEQLVYINKDLGTHLDGVWFSNLYAWDCRTVGLSLSKKNGKSKKQDQSFFDDSLEGCSGIVGWDSDDMPLAWQSGGVDQRLMEHF